MTGQRIALRNRFYAWTEVDEGLRALGHTTFPFKEAEDLRRLLDSGTEVDFVLSINYCPYIHACCRERDVAQAAWTFDSGVGRTQEVAALRPCDRLFLFNQHDFELLSPQHENTWYLPFSAGSSHQRPPRGRGFDSEILIVMNSYRDSIAASNARYENAVAEARDDMTRQFYKLIHAILELAVDQHQPIIHEDRLDEFARAAVKSCGVDPFPRDPRRRAGLFFPYGQILSSMQREALVRALADVAHVDLYGDKLWPEILGDGSGIAFHGSAGYNELPDLYNGARINVNLTQVQNLDSIAQRVFHVLAAGGFLLSNGMAEVDCFDDGVHYIHFHDLEDLADKVRYYLEHEDERLAIARNGYAEFVAKHTMRHRLQFILERMST